MTQALITAAQLRLFAPHCDNLAVAPALDVACRTYAITTPARIAAFMAHVWVESAGLTRLEEDLDYRTDTALRMAWPARFPTLASAAPYLGEPEKLAELVYGGRKDLGNNEAGDGWRFRGRGFLDITGRVNYGRASAWTGIDLVSNPDALAGVKVAAITAAAFWEVEGCNELADAGAHDAIGQVMLNGLHPAELVALKAETHRINGGLNGLDARRTQLIRAQAIWK